MLRSGANPENQDAADDGETLHAAKKIFTRRRKTKRSPLISVVPSGQSWQRLANDRDAAAAISRVRTALIIVALIIVYGTVGYRLIVGMDVLDALYMTITTIFTVGFQEVRPLGHAGRVFTITLIFSGVGAALYTLGAAFELMLSEQFSHWRLRQKMQNSINNMTGHFIICGYGRIGRQVVSDLRDAGMPYVVVDNNSARCAMLLERGIPHVEGDATLDEILLTAGVERARGLVGALNSDADNLMTVISARELNPRLFIIARAALPEAEKKLSRAGADEVISPYLVGARRMSLAMLRPAVSNFLNAVLYDRELQAEITESIIEKDSPFAGQTLSECGMAHGQEVLPLALLRQGKLMFSPLPDTVLEVGDALIIVTPIGNWRVSRS